MKTHVVIILILTSSILIGLPFQNGSADNYKINEPIWGKEYTQIAFNTICYVFPLHTGDNLTINLTSWSGNPGTGGSPGAFQFGGIRNGGDCSSPYSMIFTSTSNITTATLGYINFPAITAPYHFWMTSGSAQNIMIIVAVYSIDTASLKYSINKINATSPQDPAIKILQNQVKELQTNMTIAQTQIQKLTQQINFLNMTISNMNNTQQEMLENITNLWKSYNQLNQTLNDLITTVNNINTSLSQNITRIEQNITKIKTDITNIFNQIEDLSKDKDKVKDVQNQLNNTLKNITIINNNITQIKNTMPDEYNDTVLKNRITQLENENKALKTDLDNLKKNQGQKVIETRTDNGLIIGAFVIGIVGILIGLFAIMSKRPKAPQIDDNDKASRSKDYDDVEERPKAIPKAKAKKSKKNDEDLDDVMKKLEE